MKLSRKDAKLWGGRTFLAVCASGVLVKRGGLSAYWTRRKCRRIMRQLDVPDFPKQRIQVDWLIEQSNRVADELVAQL